MSDVSQSSSEDRPVSDKSESKAPRTVQKPDQPEVTSVTQIIQQRAPELLERLRPAERKKLSQVLLVSQTSSYFEGPIPPPDALHGYEKILPGAAERIFGLAERQSEHRQHLEKHVITNQVAESKRGQLFAFLIGCLGLCSATALGITGHETAASVIGGASLVGLVTAFLVGKYKANRNLGEKR